MSPEEMFSRHRKLAYHFAWRLARQWRAVLEPDDVIQLALLGLWQACRAYCPARGGFTNFAWIVVRNRVLMEVRRQRRHREGPYLLYDAIRRGRWTPAPAYGNPEGTALLRDTLRGMRWRAEVRDVLHGCSHTEAGRRHGLSQSLVSRRVRETQRRLEAALPSLPWDPRLHWSMGETEGDEDA